MTSDLKKTTIEELQQKLAVVGALAQQKSNFLATMSHEIRTPMQTVYGLLELIEQEKPEANILSMVKTAKNSASDLLEILDDILDFAKMDADQMHLDHFEVPVRTLVYGINEAMAVKVQGRPIILKDDIAKDVPFVVAGDPKRLRQVIMNLMGNALKFTHEGTVTIKINRTCTSIIVPQGKMGLRFEITDTGIGMKKEVAERLFQPFTQADNSTSRKYGGTGLGLSICKKLVEIMQGKIGIISQEGKGSTFWFEIPTEEISTDVTSVANMPKLDGLSILSVEDHPKGAQEIVRSLQSMGAHVESCSTYREGLALATQRPFDVSIIDQGLPDGLGLDLIKELMLIRPFASYIMYTVREDAGLQHTLQSLGITYLTKPASRLGLGEAVEDAASKIKKMSTAGPKKLLIAEDTNSVRDVLARQLTKLGVEATFVVNGKEALEQVRSGQYGIVFTDLHMPEMDGYELVATIRQDDKTLDRYFPVIALTADVQMSQRQVYISHGFDECLLKPVSLGQLQRLLLRWGLINEVQQSTSSIIPAQTATDTLPAIDITKIAEQMGAFDQNAIEMLSMFTDMTKPLLDKIEDGFKKNDTHQIREAAHSLKGAARSACAAILGDYASQLQEEAEAQKPSTSVFEKIKTEFLRVDQEIQQLKKS